jgi:hypothetical protein
MRQFYWSALCRNAGNGYAQVTVFVNRKIGSSMVYWHRTDIAVPIEPNAFGPEPVCFEVGPGQRDDEISVIDSDDAADPDEQDLIGQDSTIVDDKTGQIYRVIEQYVSNGNIIIIRLDRSWQDVINNPPAMVWVVPPPVDGGRKPCIAVYQRVIKF